MEKDFRYLIHLAELGKGNIHPHGEAATGILIEALKIQNGNKILEIGCGTGETMVRILSMYNVSVDGIDILPEMLEKAKLRLKITGLKNRGKVITGLLDNSLPFESGSYDRIYSESVLGFQTEEAVRKLVKEIYRVLKKGGLFAANDAIWKKNTSKEDIERINNSCIEDFGLSQASEQHWSLDNWNDLYTEAGFEILSNDLINNLPGKSKSKYPLNFKVNLSGLITQYYSAVILFSLNKRRESKNFNKLLAKHADDGKYIESRIFVLRKN